jgi:hypothetical protein
MDNTQSQMLEKKYHLAFSNADLFAIFGCAK